MVVTHLAMKVGTPGVSRDMGSVLQEPSLLWQATLKPGLTQKLYYRAFDCSFFPRLTNPQTASQKAVILGPQSLTQMRLAIVISAGSGRF